MHLFLAFLEVLLAGVGTGERRLWGSGSRWRSVKVCDPCLGGKAFTRASEFTQV